VIGVRFLALKTIDNFFSDLFGNFNFKSFVILLTGMILGFAIFGAVYALIIVRSLKEDETKKDLVQKETKPDETAIENEIESLKVRYQEESSGLKTGDKIQILGKIIIETINVIASKYYPESMYPLFELSIDEIISLNEYITKRLDKIFDKKMLNPFRKMNIAQVLRIIDYKKKLDENKMIKAANKLKLPVFFKYTKMALNYANPIYWFNKLVIGSTFNIVADKMALAVIDIVADETNKVYSKNIFNTESKLQTADIDRLIDSLDTEEKMEEDK
jgi:hypothetical protein